MAQNVRYPAEPRGGGLIRRRMAAEWDGTPLMAYVMILRSCLEPEEGERRVHGGGAPCRAVAVPLRQAALTKHRMTG